MLFARLTLLCLAFSVVATLASAADAASPAAPTSRATDPGELDRYVGSYEYAPGEILRVYRVDTQLHAQPTGRPAMVLISQKARAHFYLQNFPTGLEFLEDASGVVTGLDLIRTTGTRRHLRRLPDAHAAAAPLRQIALDRGTSVNAKVFPGYTRKRDADGKFLPETYVFGEGGFQEGAGVRDKSVDDISFEQIVHSLAPALARQNYHPPADPQKIDLLLMVYWGSTASEHHPAVLAEESFDPAKHNFRDQLNRRNARVLGYNDALPTTSSADLTGSITTRAGDLIAELEENRYWVALVAVDFPAVRDEKKIKPLWSIRYNTASQGTNFKAALPQMTEFADRYFGRDSGGLVSPSLPPPEGKVEIGEAIVVPEAR